MEYPAKRIAVVAFAVFVALLVLACAYFSDNRHTDIDELALYNPAYMVAHYGRSTYPAETWFDLPMIVHPPIHTGTIGLLSRLGLTWYYAAATPTVFFLLLAIWTIARGNFPSHLKLALLFSLGLLMSHGEAVASFFGSRPEGTLHSAWFAALLLLESARLSHWNRARLFAGAFLLAWASGMHYYAIPALAGLTVYLVWAVIDLGWKDSIPRLIAIFSGAVLFGLPYLALYIVPNWSSIQTVIRYHQAGADLTLASLSPLRQHLDLYRLWSAAAYLPAVLRWVLAAGVPLWVFSTAILATQRATRGLALAALPLQLGIFFFASHKPGVYLVHEIALFAVALSVGALALLDWLASRRALPSWCRTAVIPLTALCLCPYLAAATGSLRFATLAVHVHPGDVARAAAKQILGPHARVVSRPGSWYASGADSWHDYHHDLTGPASFDYDPVPYLRNFDAAVDSPFRSGFTDNQEHKSLSAWYAAGLLKLRGAYFDENDGELRQLFLSLDKPEKLVAFTTRRGAILRFDQSPSGDQEIISATCPSLPDFETGRFRQRFPEASIVVLQLPASPEVVVTVLASRAGPEPAGLLKTSCAEFGRVRGLLSSVDRDALVTSLRRQDTPIHFYSHLEDVPGFKDAGIPTAALVPEHSVPLPGVVNLTEVDAAHASATLQKVPRVLVTTPPSNGAFGAHFQIHGAERLEFPRWLRLRLRILSGRITLLVTNPDGAILGRPILLLPSGQSLDVAIPTPFRASDVVIANASDRGPSNVEVMEAIAVASPEDAVAYRRLLDTVGPSLLLGVPPGLQPPVAASRLEAAINLAEARPGSEKARIERLPQLRVTTPPARGNFAANLPLHLPDKVAGDGWIQLRLKVLSGRVGFGVIGSKGEIVARTAGFLLPTTEPVDVALKFPVSDSVTAVIVFNENLASASQAEILDAGVLLTSASSAAGK